MRYKILVVFLIFCTAACGVVDTGVERKTIDGVDCIINHNTGHIDCNWPEGGE